MGSLDYRGSGVDIDEGNRFVQIIKGMVDSTRTPNVIGGIGGFAAFFDMTPFKTMEQPVLVSSTDGVGTKLKIAFMAEKYDTVGIDLVAMCVNDLIVTGAQPLFFLDYIATGKLSAEKMADVIKGITDGCKMSGSALVGGETAEMPGMYGEGEFDLAGFSVGVVDRAKAIDGSAVRPGDVLVGIESSGFHSNGYSLLRRIFFEELKHSITDTMPDGRTVGEMLLTPTKIYVKPVLAALQAGIPVHSMVHVTGGGFYDNIPRVLPKGACAVVDPAAFPRLAAADYIRSKIDVAERELYRVFNMGIGYIFAVPADAANALIDSLASNGEKAYRIGEIVEGEEEVIIKGIDR